VRFICGCLVDRLAVILGVVSFGHTSPKENEKMIKSVKARTPILAFILFVFAAGYTFAANKVVVIPLGADAAPTAQWALVKDDGTILDQSGGIVMNKHPTPGFYYLDFGKDVSGHAIVATSRYPSTDNFVSTGACGGSAYNTAIILCDRSNNNNTVFVGVRNTSDGVNGYFYVAVLP
jgi:hypothetical protein